MKPYYDPFEPSFVRLRHCQIMKYGVRQAWAMRFGLTSKERMSLTSAVCWQLCRCKSDEARRLILGVSQ